MKVPSLSKIEKIIKHPENYVGIETYSAHIQQELEQFIFELNEVKKVRFKEGKFYCSNLTKEERWGSIWCCNLIDDILEGIVKNE